MPHLLDSVQAQTFAVPPATGGAASDANDSGSGFAALMAAPAPSNASAGARLSAQPPEALVAPLPGPLMPPASAKPKMVDSPWAADAAEIALRGGTNPGGSLPQISVFSPVIEPAESIIATPFPFDGSGFPTPRLASHALLHLDRLGEARLARSDRDIPTTASDSLVPTLHDLVMQMSNVSSGPDQQHVDANLDRDPRAVLATPTSALYWPRIDASADPSVTSGQQASVPAQPTDLRSTNKTIAPEPRLRGELRFTDAQLLLSVQDPVSELTPLPGVLSSTAKTAGDEHAYSLPAAALSLTDLLQTEAPVEPSIPVTEFARLEKPLQTLAWPEPDVAPTAGASVPATILSHAHADQPKVPPEDCTQLSIVAGSAELPNAAPMPSNPERIRKSTPHQTLAESRAIPEESTAALDLVSDPAWKPVSMPMAEERPRSTDAEKTVTSEALRMPDLTLGASFTQTDPISQATIAAAPTVTSTIAASDDNVRFTTTATSVPEANPVERIIAHQVSRAVIKHVGDGDRSLVIRLTPPELGTVRIEFRMQEGRLCAHFQAEDPAVRQALERLMPQLSGDLRQADSPIQQITVGSSANADQAFDGRGFDGRGGQHGNRQDQHGNAPRSRRGERTLFSLDGSAAAPPVVAPSPTRVLAPKGLVDTLA